MVYTDVLLETHGEAVIGCKSLSRGHYLLSTSVGLFARYCMFGVRIYGSAAGISAFGALENFCVYTS